MGKQVTTEQGNQLMEALRTANVAIASDYLHNPDNHALLQRATSEPLVSNECIRIYNMIVPHFNTVEDPEVKEMFLGIVKEYLTNGEKLPANIVTFLDHLTSALTAFVYQELHKTGILNTLVDPADRSGHPVILKMNLLFSKKEEYIKMKQDFTTINNFLEKMRQDCSMHGSTQTLINYSTNYNVDLAKNY